MMQRPAKPPIYRSAGTNQTDSWLILTSMGPVLGHAVAGHWAFLEVSAAAFANDVVELGHRWRSPRDEEESEAHRAWMQFDQ